VLPSALLLVSSLAAAPSFQARVDTYARTRSLSVDWVSSAQLDEDASREHLARLCDPREPASAVYVLEQAPGVLWSLDAPPEQRPCPSQPPPARPLPTRLELSRQEDMWESSLGGLAFREGEPVFVTSSRSGSTYGHGSNTFTDEKDWERLLFRHTLTVSGVSMPEDEEAPRDFASILPPASSSTSSTVRIEGALIPVLASPEAAATLPPTLNHVISGREQWSGEKDAAVRVVALAQGTEHVRLRIQVLDDIPVPASENPSDSELLGVDFLELRWGHDPRRQLRVARTGKGKPLVRWLQPTGAAEPTPTVALEGNTFLIDLPLARLRSNPRSDSWQAPLSVVFSDSDAPGTGTPTRVALSTLNEHRPTSFARLVSFPDHTRYPSASATAFGLLTRLAPTAAPKP
jgi:hypothetical protein